MLDFLIRKSNDKTKSDDGFTVIEFVMAFAVIAVLFGAGVYGYPKMQEWRTQSEMNVVTEWGYQSGLNVMMNPWSGLTIEEALEKSKEGHPEVVLTYEGNTRTDFCVTGTRVGDTEGKYTTQSGACGQENDDGGCGPDGGSPDPVIEDVISKMTYECDSTTRSHLGIAYTSDGITALVQGDDGSEVLLSAETEGVYATTFKAIEELTMTGGVEYEVTVNGKFDTMTNFGFGECLIKVDKIGDDTGLKTINAFAGSKLVAVPDSIPSTVTSLSRAFQGANNFNDPNISSWDVSNVTNMSRMFDSAQSFNQPLNNWDTGNVTDMGYMFKSASFFDQPLNDWDVSRVTYMSDMFNNALNFNQGISNWDVSRVTAMANMFYSAQSFDQDISNWDVSNVTNMFQMFRSARSFNQPLNDWDVSRVTNMYRMFYSAQSFNQPLNDWVVSRVTNMSGMFSNARNFNSDLNNWDVSNVTNMSDMFNSAINFNQDISNWNVEKVTIYNRFASTSFPTEYLPKFK